MSKYLAYPFLTDDAADLKCDFEILTDEISSMIGLLGSLLNARDRAADPCLARDLSTINELMYHINPSLRTRVAVTNEELQWLYGKTESLQKAVEGLPKAGSSAFFLPRGCTQAAMSHVIRVKCKALVRLLSRYEQQGNNVDKILFDFANLYSGYFFSLALWFNKIHDEKEYSFKSRVY